MKLRASHLAGAVALAAGLAVAAPALASQNIPWTWNSSDHDAKAEFVASNDTFHAYVYNPTDYVNWSGPGATGRWDLNSGSAEQNLPFNWTKGKVVTLNVCQSKTLWPDDCSGTQSGVS